MENYLANYHIPYGKIKKSIPGSNGKQTVNVVGVGKRTKYIDDSGQEWVKIKDVWWRFPQDIEY